MPFSWGTWRNNERFEIDKSKRDRIRERDAMGTKEDERLVVDDKPKAKYAVLERMATQAEIRGIIAA